MKTPREKCECGKEICGCCCQYGQFGDGHICAKQPTPHIEQSANSRYDDGDISKEAKCSHKRTVIWEPHLAGARKCSDCGMVYNPNKTPRWFFEKPERRCTCDVVDVHDFGQHEKTCWTQKPAPMPQGRVFNYVEAMNASLRWDSLRRKGPDLFKDGAKYQFDLDTPLIEKLERELSEAKDQRKWGKLSDDNTTMAAFLKLKEERDDAKAERIKYEQGASRKRYEISADLARITTQNEEMRAFITKWLDFEQSCVEKDGPYVSHRIPDLMSEARDCLAKTKAGEDT